jgi:hypothetical protein
VTVAVYSNCTDLTSRLGSFDISYEPNAFCRIQNVCPPVSVAGCSTCGPNSSLQLAGAQPGTYWVKVSAGLGNVYQLSAK